jgi:hypothetical protein
MNGETAHRVPAESPCWRDIIDGGFIPSSEFRVILQLCG